MFHSLPHPETRMQLYSTRRQKMFQPTLRMWQMSVPFRTFMNLCDWKCEGPDYSDERHLQNFTLETWKRWPAWAEDCSLHDCQLYRFALFSTTHQNLPHDGGKIVLVSRPYVSPTLIHFTAIHYQLNIGNFQSTKVVRGLSGCGSVCTAGFKGTLVNQLFNIEVVPPTCTVVKPCDFEKFVMESMQTYNFPLSKQHGFCP